MKRLTIILILCLMAGASIPGTAQERTVSYSPKPWQPTIWVSDPPAGCPFEYSSDLVGVAFTRRYVSYTDADTFYPSWAADDNMYCAWTDGEIGLEAVQSGGGEKARTGIVKITGTDPMKLGVKSLGSLAASALPYGGRYPCANLVYNGIWYHGTYGVDFDFSKPEYRDQYSWAICGPLPGFAISKDYGQTWTPCPFDLSNPLMPESGKNGEKVKLGTPHFVDFGKNMEHSPDGKAYLVGHGAIDNDPTPRVANNSWIAGDAVYMARVTPSPETINDVSQYEFYAGRGADGKALWSKDFNRIKPLLEWNDHMGCTTITWNPALRRYLMCVTDGWPGMKDMSSFILESEELTGPYRLVTYMRNFGRQAYFLNFPSRFISDNGRTAWLSYSANFNNVYFCDRTLADPIGSRYAWNLQEMMLLDRVAKSQIELLPADQPDPIKSKNNIALRSNVSVTSANKKNRIFSELITYFGEGAVDGVIPSEANTLNEWVTEGEKGTAMIRLVWSKPEKISRIWLFDRPSLKDQVTSGLLVFSDGTTLPVSSLPNDAKSCKELTFTEKTVTWVAFIIHSVSESTANAGLAEFAVFNQ